jgi:hypothetical protein
MDIFEAFKFICAHTKALSVVEHTYVNRGFLDYYTTDGFRLVEHEKLTYQRKLFVQTAGCDFFVETDNHLSRELLIVGKGDAADLIAIATKLYSEQALTIARLQRASLATQLDKMIHDLGNTTQELIQARESLMKDNHG